MLAFIKNYPLAITPSITASNPSEVAALRQKRGFISQ